MFRAVLFSLAFWRFQEVYVNAELEKWCDASNSYFNEVQKAFNLTLSSSQWKYHNFVTVDQFALRVEDHTQGVVVGHNNNGMYLDFWVDGIGIENETGCFMIKKIHDHISGESTLQETLDNVQSYVDNMCDGPSEPLCNTDLKAVF